MEFYNTQDKARGIIYLLSLIVHSRSDSGV